MIQVEQYLRRLDSIQLQYEFAREAIKGHIERTDVSAASEMPDFETMIPLDRLLDVSEEEFADWMDKYVESFKGGFPAKHKELENRLAQNEIILMVAVFEDMLKSIHREMLRQKPTFLNPDREIPLGKLTALGGEKVIEEEIERAVQSLDRQTVAERAKAFQKIGLPWNTKPEDIEGITRLRNEILHENVDRSVSGWELHKCRTLMTGLPLHLCYTGWQLFPDAFEMSSPLVDYYRRRLATDPD